MSYIEPYLNHSDKKLTPRDYQDALYVQSAVNLSGIVISLSNVIGLLRQEAQLTSWINNHPLIVLYMATIMHLTGEGIAGMERYSQAYRYCEARANPPAAAPDAHLEMAFEDSVNGGIDIE